LQEEHEKLKHRNDELERQLQSSDRSKSPSTEEMKLKLAHFFKQKYQKEIGDLKAKLIQYVSEKLTEILLVQKLRYIRSTFRNPSMRLIRLE